MEGDVGTLKDKYGSMVLPLLGVAAMSVTVAFAIKAKREKGKARKEVKEGEKEAKSLMERGDELIEEGEKLIEKGIRKLARRS